MVEPDRWKFPSPGPGRSGHQVGMLQEAAQNESTGAADDDL